MKQNIENDRNGIIIRFLIGMAIWIGILLIITFWQSSYSRGLFFLSTMGISFAYILLCHIFQPSIFPRTEHRNTFYDRGLSTQLGSPDSHGSFVVLMELILVPGRMLGACIFGILQLRSNK